MGRKDLESRISEIVAKTHILCKTKIFKTFTIYLQIQNRTTLHTRGPAHDFQNKFKIMRVINLSLCHKYLLLGYAKKMLEWLMARVILYFAFSWSFLAGKNLPCVLHASISGLIKNISIWTAFNVSHKIFYDPTHLFF